MPDLRILKLQAQRQLKQSLALANQFFNKEFTIPVMNFELRGQKAGVAYLQQNELRLNPVLLVENGAAFIQQVVPHELAHLLVYQQFGRVQPHGKEWKMMMEQVLGVPAHISYQCDCQTHLLSVRRHNAIQRNQRSYICRNCNQPLRLLLA